MVLNNEISIKATDGRVFKGTLDKIDKIKEELNAHESDLKLKAEKAEAERKAKEQKDKELAGYSKTMMDKINEKLYNVKSDIDEYEKKTGKKLLFEYDVINQKIRVREVKNSLDFAYCSPLVDFFEARRRI